MMRINHTTDFLLVPAILLAAASVFVIGLEEDSVPTGYIAFYLLAIAHRLYLKPSKFYSEVFQKRLAGWSNAGIAFLSTIFAIAAVASIQNYSASPV